MNLTRHAEKRIAQRSIHKMFFDFLIDEGVEVHEEYQKGGTFRISLKNSDKDYI